MVNDELVWKPVRDKENNWRARNSSDDGTYAVSNYGTPFTYGVLLSDNGANLEVYVSGVASLDAAKRACQEHHNKAARANRWAMYMRDNEPPVTP